MNEKVEGFLDGRSKSKAIFKLKSSSTVHRVNELKTPYLKERLLIISEGLHDTIKTGDKDETREIIDKIEELTQTTTVGKVMRRGYFRTFLRPTLLAVLLVTVTLVVASLKCPSILPFDFLTLYR